MIRTASYGSTSAFPVSGMPLGFLDHPLQLSGFRYSSTFCAFSHFHSAFMHHDQNRGVMHSKIDCRIAGTEMRSYMKRTPSESESSRARLTGKSLEKLIITGLLLGR
jgi:hypothetical protein